MVSSLLGVRMTLMLGPTVAVPVPQPVAEALSSIEVTQDSEGRDGFQLTFTLGRGRGDALDYPLLANPLLRPFNRMVIQAWLGVTPEVLIDGFITKYQVTPGNEPGSSTLVVTGEDVRVMMDLREFAIGYSLMTPEMRVATILMKYALYLVAAPLIVPRLTPDLPLRTDRIPNQSGTDLRYIEELARDAGYVFYVEPTGIPMINQAYWGPQNRLSEPQSALSINLGPETNVTSLNFTYDGLAPTTVLGLMLDKRTGIPVPIVTVSSTRPPLALLPAMVIQQPDVRSVLPRDSGGLDPVQAQALAQALTDNSSDAVSAQGELDATRYGKILRPRRLVGVRGAGFLLDGLYYVKRVTHRIKRGEYKQSFSLTREGLGALTPVVIP